MNKMSKSERIFRQTMASIRLSIDHFGIGGFDATSLDCSGTDGNICQRTINDVTKQLDSYECQQAHFVKYLGEDKYTAINREAIRIMRNTIANAQRDYVDWFKSI